MANLNRLTAARNSKLGDKGETLAERCLKKHGFVDVRNLNNERANHPFADLYAEKGSVRYVVSVKTRNEFEVGGGVNSSYKLTRNEKRLREVEAAYSAQAAWVAVCVNIDAKTFSAYFGLVKDLQTFKRIPMNIEARGAYYCLADDEPWPFDAGLKNTYEP